MYVTIMKKDVTIIQFLEILQRSCNYLTLLLINNLKQIFESVETFGS